MKVASLWRYPVKSMKGEEMNACDITAKGVRGDRAYGIVDIETGKLANAKNPKNSRRCFITVRRSLSRIRTLSPFRLSASPCRMEIPS